MAIQIGEHNNRKERIGRMRHKAYFLTPTESRDAAGGEVITWVSGSEFWCNVDYTPVGTDDEDLADRLTNVTTAKLTTRYRTCSPKNKVVYDGLEWEIHKVLPGSHKRFLVLEISQYKPE